MTDHAHPNPYAPPRAPVTDHVDAADRTMVVATRGARLASVLIDVLPFALLGIGAAVVLPLYSKHAKGAPSAALGVFIAILLLALFGLLAYSTVLVYRHGQSIGKKALGIRVVRTDGSRVSFGRFVFLRWLPMGLAGKIPFVGWIASLGDALAIFGRDSRCLHDLIADTMVVTAESSPNATLAGSRFEHLRTFTG